MSRTPSMTPAECEAILGARGYLRVTSANYLTVRKWCTANGLPGSYVAGLAYAQLAYCYNGRNGQLDLGINYHKTQAANAGAVATPNDADIIESPLNEVGAKIEAVKDWQGAEIVQEKPQPSRGGLEGAIEAIVIDILTRQSPPIDAKAILDIVRGELNGIAPREIVIREGDKAEIKINAHVPGWFERVLKLLKQGQNVCLVGPAGCGKTYIVKLMASALGCERHTIVSGSAGVSESAITGRLLPTGENGRFEYTASEFVDCFEKGDSLICLDEIDAFDSNMLMAVNMPTANGHMYVPHRTEQPMVTRGENVYFLATANTFGTSANPIYSARNQLDGATLDRWLFVTVDYDTKYEEQSAMARGLTAVECSKLWELRNKVRESELRRVISTRAFVKAADMRSIGDSWSTVMDTLTAGWSKDEKAKVGLAA